MAYWNIGQSVDVDWRREVAKGTLWELRFWLRHAFMVRKSIAFPEIKAKKKKKHSQLYLNWLPSIYFPFYTMNPICTCQFGLLAWQRALCHANNPNWPIAGKKKGTKSIFKAAKHKWRPSSSSCALRGAEWGGGRGVGVSGLNNWLPLLFVVEHAKWDEKKKG